MSLAEQGWELVRSDQRKYCLCSDPDYCLRYVDDDLRRRAIAYRRAHGAPLPKDAQNDGPADEVST